MKKKWEVRYIVTAVASIPVYKTYGKTEAYRHAAKDGWGTVYRDEENNLVCDEDCSVDFFTKNGGYYGLSGNDEVNTKDMWRTAVKYVLSAVLGGVVVFIMSRIGIS